FYYVRYFASQPLMSKLWGNVYSRSESSKLPIKRSLNQSVLILPINNPWKISPYFEMSNYWFTIDGLEKRSQ
ncbi:hypothetical protein BB560_003513, partial [Smittium megazygosporum]